MDGNLTHLGDEHIALDADDVADVQQAFEDGVVERLVLAGAYLVTLDVELYATRMILQLNKRGGPHDAAAHDAAGDADLLEEAVVLRVALQDVGSDGIDLIEVCRIGVDTQRLEFGEGVPADLFLFSQFGHWTTWF